MINYLYGVLTGLVMLLVFMLYYYYKDQHNKKYGFYWFSIVKFEFMLIKEEPVKMINGRIYTERFCNKSDKSIIADSVYLGCFPLINERERDLAIAKGSTVETVHVEY